MPASAGADHFHLEPFGRALHVHSVAASYAELEEAVDGLLAEAADCDAGLAGLAGSEPSGGGELLEARGAGGVRGGGGEGLGGDGLDQAVLHSVGGVLEHVEAPEDVDPAL